MTATTEAAAAALRRLGVPVVVGRFEAVADASGPSILLRLADVAALGTIDPAPGPAALEIECRAPTADGARALADDALAALAEAGELIAFDRFSPRSSPSAMRGRYFAMVAEATWQAG